MPIGTGKSLDASAVELDNHAMNPNSPLEQRIFARFGCVPNFFRLASADQKIAANLWGFAEFAYLDNPITVLHSEDIVFLHSRAIGSRSLPARISAGYVTTEERHDAR